MMIWSPVSVCYSSCCCAFISLFEMQFNLATVIGLDIRLNCHC